MRLNAKTVALHTAPPPGKADAIHFDDELCGFGLRLRRNGNNVRRSFVAQYRVAGRTRRVLIGSADTLTAEQARTKAKSVLASAALGQDPQQEKKEQRRRGTVLRAVIDEFLAAKQNRRARTTRELERYLAGPLYLKTLHNMPIDSITRRDVAARLLAVTREHSPTVARHVRAKLSSLFVWAMSMGIAESNPVTGTPKPELAPGRERVLDDNEFAAVWNACIDNDTGRIVKLLALTGARRSEVGGMCWSELDRSRGTWTLPAARSKNKRNHTLTLPSEAWAIIDAVPAQQGRDQLFGDRSAAGFASWGPAKKTLDDKLGTAVRPWTLHDLRRTAATRMIDLGVGPHVVEAALNHVSGHRAGVAGIYNRATYEREIRNALAQWAEHVLALVGGRGRKVVAIRA